MKLTQELCNKIINHLEERRPDLGETDLEDGEISEVDDAIKILKENIGKELTHIDHTLVDRLMDDSDLFEKFEEVEEKEIGRNAFGD